MEYSSPTFDDVDDAEQDAHGTEVGQGEEGGRLGVGGHVPERAERGAGGQSPATLRQKRAERGHTASVQSSWPEGCRTAKAAASVRRCMPSLASSEDT